MRRIAFILYSGISKKNKKRGEGMTVQVKGKMEYTQ